mmetsp:Transcript_41756/g.48230  ORF Transcript_41756/g.48230 Transcript_41756/m.48230 type:complete len:241 (-) Transcript_41756:25-747(-)
MANNMAELGLIFQSDKTAEQTKATLAEWIFKARDEDPACYENAMCLIGWHNLEPSSSQKKRYSEDPRLAELRLREFEFYREKIKIDRETFIILKEIYSLLEPFDYKAVPGKIETIYRKSHTGTWFVYVGEIVSSGLEIRKGMGITVYASGEIYEGYRIEVKPHYFGRYIHISGLVRTCGYNKGNIYGCSEEHTIDLTQSPRRAMSPSKSCSQINFKHFKQLKRKVSVISFHETEDMHLWK